MLYDSLLVIAVLVLATAIVLAVRKGEIIESGTWWFNVYLVFVAYCYMAWCWMHGGQTLGMKTWKFQVVQFDGTPITIQQTIIRFIGGILSWACFGLGYLWVLWDKDRLAWHDYLSKTKLVFIKPEAV